MEILTADNKTSNAEATKSEAEFIDINCSKEWGKVCVVRPLQEEVAHSQKIELMEQSLHLTGKRRFLGHLWGCMCGGRYRGGRSQFWR